MRDNQLNMGVIGCGFMGQLRARAIQSNPTISLRAVSDKATLSAQRLSTLYNIDFEMDWRSLIQRGDVDAVIISTPPSTHAEICIEALNSGKHVLCEKPLARNPAECQSILDVAQKKNLLMATGFNYRFYPSIIKAREYMNAGVIGELDHIRSYAGYSADDHAQPWLHDVDIVGGGALYDNGIHLIDLTCHFLGDVSEVIGFTSNLTWKFKGCEDNGFALLRTREGKIASLHASWTEWGKYRFLIEIYGTQGYIRMSCFPMLTQVIERNKNRGRGFGKFHVFPKVNLMEHFRSYSWLVEQSLVLEHKAFHHTILGNKTPLASCEDGLRAVKIAYEVSHLHQINRQVKR